METKKENSSSEKNSKIQDEVKKKNLSKEEREKKNKEEKKKYDARKRVVFEMEKDNNDKLIFFKQNADWWRLGGVSAVLYSNAICKRIGLTAKLRDDTDYSDRFDYGITSVRKDRMKLMEEMLLIADVKLIEKRDDEIWIFQLPEKYTKQAVQDLSKLEMMKRRKVYEEIVGGQILLNAMKVVRKLTREVDIATAKKPNGRVKNEIVKNLAGKILELNMDLTKIARKRLSLTQGINKLKTSAEIIGDLIAQGVIYGALDLDVSMRIAPLMTELDKAIDEDERDLRAQAKKGIV